jgi:type I site-specific restriction-modification system R (restriction) subunit
MGISLDENLGEGLAQLIEKMNGLESALDPQKLKEHLENMGEEFIPTPAKIVPFHSEEEILAQEGDIFFIGNYKNVGNAVLGVNALPILYQARYREQEAHKILNEIELLISQIERNESTVSPSVMTPGIDIEQKLLKEFIPNMLYCIKEPSQFKEAEEQFRDFMRGYRFKEDVDAIVTLIGSKEQLGAQDYRLLELYAKKIAAVKKEDFSAAEVYSKEIQSLRSE